jgi:adenosylcobinamide-GDP ribazoletransferase
MNEPPARRTPALLTPLIDFLLALQFLTLMPPVVRRPYTPDEMGRTVAYYPLVGFALGAVLAGADHLLSWFFPPPVSAALLLIVWTLSTGALHVDGFLDACDGLLGGSTPEHRLEVMRDHRIGAFAFTGGALLFLTKFTALATTSARLPALLLAPVMGRWGMALALVAFPYARAQGLGRDLKDHATWRQAFLATILALGGAWLTAGRHGLMIASFAALVMLACARFTLKRIPGLTGDIYGMLNEIIEAIVLLAFCVT